MMGSTRMTLSLAAALLAAWPASAGAQAQSERDQQERRQQQTQQTEREQNQRSQSQREQQRQQEQRNQQRQSRQQQSRTGDVNPDLIIVGYDLNRDGATDFYHIVERIEFDRLNREFNRQRSQANQRQGEQRTQSAQRTQSNQERTRSSRRMQSDQQRQPTTLSGRIQNTRQVQITGQRDRHNLVRIQLQSGRSALVNLGPKKTIEDLKVQTGDTVRVTGRRGAINGRPVLMAQSVEVDGRNIRVSRQESRSSTSRRQQTSFTGRVEDTHRISLRGEQKEHNLVRITTTDGQSHIVNLGPDKRLTDLNARQGDRIRVEGRRGKIDGRSVVMATSVSVDGETTRITWNRQQRESEGVYGTPRDQQDQQDQQDRQQSQQDQRSQQEQWQQDQSYETRKQSDRSEFAPRQGQGQGQGQMREYTFRGTLEAFHRAFVEGSDDRHTFVKMWLQNGESMTVDLGSQVSLAQLGLIGLADDERIVVRGKTERKGDRTVLKAESITIDGRTTSLRASSGGSTQRNQP